MTERLADGSVSVDPGALLVGSLGPKLGAVSGS